MAHHKAENVRKLPRSKRAQVTLSDDIGELAIDPYPREERDAEPLNIRFGSTVALAEQI